MRDFKKDHGYAWVVCFASFFYQIVRGGLIYTAGVLFVMFRDALEASDSKLALITSLHYSISYLSGPLVGLLVERFGERPVAMVGSIIATLGIALSSLSTNVLHMYICYSLLNGIGIGLTYNPALTILSKYFKRHYKLATGISMCGSGVGSLTFPLIIQKLEAYYGWRGTLLMLAGLCAQTLFISVLFRPTPQVTIEKTHNEQDPNECDSTTSRTTKDKLEVESKTSWPTKYRHLVTPDFLYLCLHSALCVFSSTLVYTHIGNYVLSLHYKANDMTIIYSVMGGFVTASRLVFGVIPDLLKLDSHTLPCVAAIINGLLTAVFPTFTALYNIYLYCICFAILISPYNSLCAPMTNDSVPTDLLPTAYGIVCMVCVPSVVGGAPLAAYIYRASSVYAYSFYLASTFFILSGISLLPTLPSFKRRICTSRK